MNSEKPCSTFYSKNPPLDNSFEWIFPFAHFHVRTIYAEVRGISSLISIPLRVHGLSRSTLLECSTHKAMPVCRKIAQYAE